MFEKIYLHTGLPKTGTSYLQNALDVLSQKGMLLHTSYPVLNENEDFTRIQSGNGEAIAFQLLQKHVPDFSTQTVTRLTQRLFDAADTSKPNLLVSSEHFSDAAPERMDYLLELLNAQAREVEFIIFVRPFDDLCYSRYHQQIKRHAQSADYDETFFKSFGERLVTQLSLIDVLSNTVHIFDYSRDGLLGVLLNFLGEDPGLQGPFNNKAVNRSLTSLEVDLLRTINAVFKNDALCTSISDRWIYAQPEAVSAKKHADRLRIFDVFRNVVSENTSRLAGSVCREMLGRLLPDYINLSSGGSASALALASEPRENHVDENINLFRMALEEVANLSGAERKLDQYTHSLTSTCDAFDPVHYLLLNRDVLAAGVDPVKHFKQFGRNEGRFSSFITIPKIFD